MIQIGGVMTGVFLLAVLVATWYLRFTETDRRLYGAFLACAIWVAATFVFPLMLPMLIEHLLPATTGGVGMSIGYISTGPLVLIAIVAFTAGLTWRLRRHRRTGRIEIG